MSLSVIAPSSSVRTGARSAPRNGPTGSCACAGTVPRGASVVKGVGRRYVIVMIPVIDLGPYLAPRPHASAATAAELGRALQDVGFFVIVNHGIPQTLIDDTFAEARRFHAPLTEDPAWL